jgi:transcriptional regulator with XRE-family HTH domain
MPRDQALSAKEPHPFDLIVGLRIRQRRKHLGLSQTALAAALGVTYQQVQKYEQGLNQLSAARLFKIADALAVPVSSFFDGLPPPSRVADRRIGRRRSKSTSRQEKVAGVEAEPS